MGEPKVTIWERVVSLHTPPLLPQMELSDLLKPIADHIQEIQQYRERHRGSSLFNHLSAVSESIPALGWVAVVRRSTHAHTHTGDTHTLTQRYNT